MAGEGVKGATADIRLFSLPPCRVRRRETLCMTKQCLCGNHAKHEKNPPLPIQTAGANPLDAVIFLEQLLDVRAGNLLQHFLQRQALHQRQIQVGNLLAVAQLHRRVQGMPLGDILEDESTELLGQD